MLDEMAHNDKHAGISEDHTHNMSKGSAFFVIVLSRNQLRFWTEVDVKSAVEAA